MLELKSITKRYQTDTIETTALNDINMSVASGEYLAIMGPSGCGKSTLLNTLGMLDAPDTGQYFFKDVDVSKYNESKRSQLRKATVGFIFQSFHLIDELTVYENIELGLIYQKIDRAQRKKIVHSVAEKTGIDHRIQHYPKQLSGGQQQRVAIARAIAGKPDLLLADEPTGNLDSNSRAEINVLLKNLNKEGSTIILVTHSEEEAIQADRIIKLFDGKIVDDRKNN